jgi:hypothetical protein
MEEVVEEVDLVVEVEVEVNKIIWVGESVKKIYFLNLNNNFNKNLNKNLNKELNNNL